MNFQSITKLQKDYGFFEMQQMINEGTAWKMEGSFGREAMQLLDSGICMLPKIFKVDYYGNTVPSRDVLKDGTKGSYGNCRNYWTKVRNGEIEVFEDEF